MENRCDINAPHDDVVAKLKAKMPEASVFCSSTVIFQALSNDTRMKIIWALNRSELCVCDLAELLNMTQSAISHQLSGLKKDRIVINRKAGKEVFYSLADAHISNMLESGMEHAMEMKL